MPQVEDSDDVFESESTWCSLRGCNNLEYRHSETEDINLNRVLLLEVLLAGAEFVGSDRRMDVFNADVTHLDLSII